MTQPPGDPLRGSNQPTDGEHVSPTEEQQLPSPQVATPYPPAPGYAEPPSPAYQPPPPATTEGTAIIALVCAILSWIALPVVLAIVALVLARSAEREIDRSGGQKSGEGLVTASRWVAWIHLLVVAMIIAFLAAFVVAVAIAR